jgi:hypothetical protein
MFIPFCICKTASCGVIWAVEMQTGTIMNRITIKKILFMLNQVTKFKIGIDSTTSDQPIKEGNLCKDTQKFHRMAF